MVLDKIPNTQLFTQRDVRETSGTGSTPAIVDFTNSQHDHSNAAGGGAISPAAHTQNTDTAVGSGAVAVDHGTASTDQIINVSYGTSSTPPTATDTTIGSIYIQYTA